MRESSRLLIIAGHSFDEGMSMSQPAPFSILFVQMKSASDLFCLGLVFAKVDGFILLSCVCL